ncbi:MAG: DUF1775 domain-containing protein [Alicyclobacillus sp.]|nr:DUF1775 domain-containing protein [Alicyclobacillus sp.]
MRLTPVAPLSRLSTRLWARPCPVDTSRLNLWLQRSCSLLAGVLAALALSIAPVWAHVVVLPASSPAGAWEQYTMRVPTEKPQPTVKVVLTVPAGVTFEQYQPVPGWTVSEQKDSSGRITTVVWTATAGGIAPGQFQTFSFTAKNPSEPGNLAWNAFQQYQDGTIVEWTGAPGSDTPHSITHLLATDTTNGSAGTVGTPGAPPAGAVNSSSAANPVAAVHPVNPWPTVAAVAALVLSVISLVVSLRARR